MRRESGIVRIGEMAQGSLYLSRAVVSARHARRTMSAGPCSWHAFLLPHDIAIPGDSPS